MRKKLKHIIAVALSLALIAAGVFTIADRQAVWGHAEGMTDEEIQDQLRAMNNSDFIKDFNLAILGSLESTAGVPWITVAVERVADFSDTQMIDEITKVGNFENISHWWLELYNMKHEDDNQSDPRLLAMLADITTPDNLKGLLIVSLNFDTPQSKEILANVALEATDPGLIYNAVKYLDKADPNMAQDLATDILNDYENQSDGRVQGAIRIFTNKLQSPAINVRSSEKTELLYKCQTILANSENATLKDSIVGSLMLMGDYDALQMIVNSADVDEIMKSGTIDGNYYVLEEILQNQPTKADIDFTVKCMEILPVADLYEPLETAISAFPQQLSAGELSEYTTVLDKIRADGVPAKTDLKDAKKARIAK